MNTKKHIWDFLLDLQKNNNKEWMDEHRSRYHKAKDYWLAEVEQMLERLAKHDVYFEHFKPKETISRINNNKVFHPDKPTYKGHFSFSPANKTSMVSKVFFAFGPEFTMIGGGIYRPDKVALESIRGAIDYEGDKLIELLDQDDFKSTYGGLAEDEHKLKTSPNGYRDDHTHVDLLRYKSFTAQYEPTKKELLEGSLADIIEDHYLKLRPFTAWIEKALSV